MKKASLREEGGSELVVERVNRTFLDDEKGAFEAGRELKKRYRGSKIQIRTRATGVRETLEDSRRILPSTKSAGKERGRQLRRLSHRTSSSSAVFFFEL